MASTKNTPAQTNYTYPDVSAAVEPWVYNPSGWRQRVPICILAAIATVIATYLALYQWRLLPWAWDPIFGDETMRVLDSDVSEQMRMVLLVPDAAFGALAYFGDLIFCLAGSERRWHCRPWIVIIFSFLIVPVGIVSVILVILQGTVVGFWCFLCIMTAVASGILIFWAYDEIWSCYLFLYRVWRRTGSWAILLKTIFGRPTPEANEIALSMIKGFNKA